MIENKEETLKKVEKVLFLFENSLTFKSFFHDIPG